VGECFAGGADAWDGVLDRRVWIGDGIAWAFAWDGSVAVDGWDGVVVIPGSGAMLMMTLDGDCVYSNSQAGIWTRLDCPGSNAVYG
jgi:hypothetical protein